LEARWFLDGSNDGQVMKRSVHSMPFQRRNISYWRGSRNNVQHRRRRHRKIIEDNNALKRSYEKKLDLLYTVWKHRVRKYNDAFLKSPRRATRNFSKTISDPTSFIINIKARDEENRRTPQSSFSIHNKNEQKDAKSIVHPSKKDIFGTVSTGTTNNGSRPDNFATSSVFKDLEQASMNITLEKKNANPKLLSQNVCFNYSAQRLENSCGLVWSQDGSPSSAVELKTRVVFHFLYLKKQTVCIQTDTTNDLPPAHRFCPFCFLDCGTDSGLTMHCVTCHGEQLSFQAARSEDGSLHIAAMKKNDFSTRPTAMTLFRDFCYLRPKDKRNRQYASVPFVERTPYKVAGMDLAIRRKKSRFLSELSADESVLRNFLPSSDVPIRQYFHSRSNEPMLDGEWNIDSDEEDDERWLTKMSEELLEDFEDVTKLEKRFTKLWNRFMRVHVVLIMIFRQDALNLLNSMLQNLSASI